MGLFFYLCGHLSIYTIPQFIKFLAFFPGLNFHYLLRLIAAAAAAANATAVAVAVAAAAVAAAVAVAAAAVSVVLFSLLVPLAHDIYVCNNLQMAP